MPSREMMLQEMEMVEHKTEMVDEEIEIVNTYGFGESSGIQ